MTLLSQPNNYSSPSSSSFFFTFSSRNSKKYIRPTSLNKLCFPLYSMICEYVTHPERRRLLNISPSIFPKDLRYELIYFNLNTMHSIKFCDDECFRQIVLSKMKSSFDQLSLNLTNLSCKNQVLYYFYTNSLSKLQVLENDYQFINLSFFNQIQDLSIQGFPNLLSLEGLSNLRKLTLIDCRKLTTIPISIIEASPKLLQVKLKSCVQLTNISALKNVPILEIEDCPNISGWETIGNHYKCTISNIVTFTQTSVFQKVKYLTIKNCTNVTTTEGLTNVYSLQLIQLNRLIDISALGNNYSLLLDSCPLITNIFHLLNVSRLSIQNCSQVKNLQPLRNNHEMISLFLKSIPSSITDISWVHMISSLQSIELYDCANITDVSCLRNVPTVVLYHCMKISDVSSLGNVENLSINYCSYFSSIQGLGKAKQKRVQIKGCPGVQDYSPIRNVPHVFIGFTKFSWKKKRLSASLLDSATTFTSSLHPQQHTPLLHHRHHSNADSNPNFNLLHAFHNQSLTLESCFKLKSFHYFQHIHTLTISYCPRVAHTKGLMNIPIIVFNHCIHLQDLTGLGNHEKLIFENCLEIQDVTSLKLVKEEIHFFGCPKLRDISMLTEVKLIKVKLSKNQCIRGIPSMKNVVKAN